MYYLTFLLCYFFVCTVSSYEILRQVVRTTPNGQISGNVVKAKNKAEVFFGVPYSQPPVGTLRFQYPRPPSKWQGIMNCTKPKHLCYQFMILDANLNETEDCLYLNIFTPADLDSSTSLPVLAWIHGGSYSSDGANMFPVDGTVNNLVSKNIIVVFINYRLGPLGFMSLGNQTLPGNYGLEDQLAALQWIKNNIRYFNGNPNNVTVTGESAGAACASLLAMSPKSQGLFSRVFIRSGSGLAPWAVNIEQTVKNTKFVLDKLGCRIDNEIELQKCLVSASLRDLKTYIKMIITDLKTVVLFPSFTPVVDDFRANQSILPLKPEKLIKTGARMPLIVGITSAESLGHLHALCRVWLIRNKIQNITKTTKFPYSEIVNEKPTKINWNIILPAVLFKNSRLSYQSIQMKYFDNGIVSENRTENLFILTQALSDYFMVSPSIMEAKYYADKKLPVYLYKFNYKSNFLSVNSGICKEAKEYYDDSFHGVDTALLFQSTAVLGYEKEFKKFSSSDLQITNSLSQQISNFVQSGTPNSKIGQNYSWELFSSNTRLMLSFDASDQRMVPIDDKANFWFEVLPIIERLKIDEACSNVS